jgi:hypothetical protein
MNNYKFMVLSTCFTRNIAGHDIDFSLSVDCTGKIRVAPSSNRVEELFPDGLVMEFLDDELLIYPYDATPTVIKP